MSRFYEYAGGWKHSLDIPELTKIVTGAAFPNSSAFITMRDELGPTLEDEGFVGLNLVSLARADLAEAAEPPTSGQGNAGLGLHNKMRLPLFI